MSRQTFVRTSCTIGLFLTLKFDGATLVTGPAPTGMVAGDFYINTTAGVASNTWTGIAGQQVATNQFVFYTSSNIWELGGITDASL